MVRYSSPSVLKQKLWDNSSRSDDIQSCNSLKPSDNLCQHRHCACFLQDTQEGQHPLTGQRAANFRLIANQWAECRLVTQWHHGCHTTRRSVCNAGASNVGRSLCVQISRERSYPLPIYWYHSKCNWLRYKFAADSFYIMKLCSRLFVLYCRSCPKDNKFR